MNYLNIKKYLKGNIGKRIIVVYKGNRNKKDKFVGFLYKVYNNLFAIKMYDENIRVFNYADILTGVVKIYI